MREYRGETSRNFVIQVNKPPANPTTGSVTSGDGDDDESFYQSFWELREDGGYELREDGGLEQRQY